MRALALGVLLISAPALADTPPPVQPLRDVDITYKVPVPGVDVSAILQRVRYSAALRLQRLDLPTSGNWMLLDYPSHKMAMVREQSHEIVEVPAPASAGLPGAGAGFTRLGATAVNGLPCTEWRTVDNRGQEMVACYTADGVMLRASNVNGLLMEAIDVKYVTEPASVFALPSGYSRQTPGIQP